MPDTVDELTLDHGGHWLLTTESGSKYLFDLEVKTVARLAQGEPLEDQLTRMLDGQRPTRC